MKTGPKIYTSAAIYVDSRTSIKAKITALDAIIDAHISSLLKAAQTSNIEEYELDDGQVRIRTQYRSVKEVSAALSGFEAARQIYINRLNGRKFKLIDENSFKWRKH